MIRRVEDVRVPLIIPAYEPDDRMLILLEKLRDNYNDAIVIVNDGSGEEYSKYYFAAENYGFTVLKHYQNMGKGRALKNAFNHCLNEYPKMAGCITADSDGQHTLKDILRCREMLLRNSKKLILGCRDFNDKNVPGKVFLEIS